MILVFASALQLRFFVGWWMEEVFVDGRWRELRWRIEVTFFYDLFPVNVKCEWAWVGWKPVNPVRTMLLWLLAKYVKGFMEPGDSPQTRSIFMHRWSQDRKSNISAFLVMAFLVVMWWGGLGLDGIIRIKLEWFSYLYITLLVGLPAHSVLFDVDALNLISKYMCSTTVWISSFRPCGTAWLQVLWSSRVGGTQTSCPDTE